MSLIGKVASSYLKKNSKGDIFKDEEEVLKTDTDEGNISEENKDASNGEETKNKSREYTDNKIESKKNDSDDSKESIKKKETTSDNEKDVKNGKDGSNEKNDDAKKGNTTDDTKQDANIMNMFLSYIQKNKDDPNTIQKVLSMMNSQGINANTESGNVLNSVNTLNKEQEKRDGEKKDGEKRDGEKRDGEKRDGEKRDGEKRDGEKKDTNDILNDKKNNNKDSDSCNVNSNSKNEKINNMFNTSTKPKDENNNQPINLIGYGNKSDEKDNLTDDDKNNLPKIKTKHDKLVDDNDEYEVEDLSNQQDVKPLEDEAVSLISNLNIKDNDKNKSSYTDNTLISGNKGVDNTQVINMNKFNMHLYESNKMDIYKSDMNKIGINSENNTNAMNNFTSFRNLAGTGNNNLQNNINYGENKLNNYSNNENSERQEDMKLYHSKNTWEELKIDNELIQILTYLKFFHPSKIQACALPYILHSNKNLIAQSQNGSGKTLTFVIAMLSKINRRLRNLQALCICPTRELAQQNYDVVNSFGKHLGLNIFLAVPLCPKYNKNSGFQIYVGTPGKSLDFFKRKYIDTENIKIFVLDEADDLIDVKNNMSSQVDAIKRFIPRTCQMLLFSATYNDEVRLFADQFAPYATKISVKQENLTLTCVKQYYLITENEEAKYYYLSELYCSMTISQCVIFVNSKKSAYDLYYFMTENSHNVTLICADSVISRSTKNKIQKANVIGMDPKTRDSLMSDFKKGISKVLICTDLLSRGIDVPSISLVINFDLPYIYEGRINSMNSANQRINMETYIHRIGRTGRFGTRGMAINFIRKDQLPHIRQIEKFYKCVIADLEFDSELMISSLSKAQN
ncbi:DEAD/DEAH box helicase/Helicase conserved C-terminal domain containing protein, putative [Hepatocystis sp. ex Piliocolobus tephrosceles]|nr:DEAD/DEAH box helicase/Helicase conserved C-terminal domain containing protein, putative [Hepatocystis sp. ex Piliocolobus tephrosceles]